MVRLPSVPIREAFAAANVLGECPLWDDRRAGLWWIDIKCQLVCFGQPDEPHSVKRWETPSLVGCLALTESGELLVLGDALWSFVPETGTFALLRGMPTGESVNNRFNDGRVDAHGVLWIGTMDNAEQERTGVTYCIADIDERTEPEVLWADSGIPNAMCFSPDGTRAYCGDSWSDVLWVVDRDPQTGAPGQRRTFANVPRPGFADGACTDADGYVWLCLWGRGAHRTFRTRRNH